LPKPKRQRAAAGAPTDGAAAASERTATESQLFEIWAQVLATPAFDIDDDFFALGGDSLGLMEIGLALRSQLQVQVEPASLLAATTVRAMARCVDAARGAVVGAVDGAVVGAVAGALAGALAGAAAAAGEGAAATPVMPLTASELPEAEPVPASLEQQAFWQVARALRAWPLSHTSEVVGLPSPLHARALQCAVDAVVARHGVLRSVLSWRGGQLWQRVLPATAVVIERLGVEADGLAPTVARLVQRPLDLERGPVSRWALLSTPETAPETAPKTAPKTAHWLVLVVHHAMTDGHTTETLVHELLRGYEAGLQGRAIAAAPLALRYGDYAQWQHRRLQAGAFEAARRQWAQLLAHAPAPVRLPSERPRRAIARWQGGRETLRVGAGLRTALKATAARRKVTLYMVLLAAFDVFLWEATGQADLVVGTSLAGRPDARLHDLGGCFIGAVPMRVRLQQGLTWAALLEQVRQVCLQASALQDLPLGMALEGLNPGAGAAAALAGGARLPVWLELHDRRQGWEKHFAHLGARRHDVDRGISESEFSLEVDDDGEELVFFAQYKSELFAAARVQAWLLRVRQLLQALADDTDERLPAVAVAPTRDGR
jgi:acyl carrier protein